MADDAADAEAWREHDAFEIELLSRLAFLDSDLAEFVAQARASRVRRVVYEKRDGQRTEFEVGQGLGCRHVPEAQLLARDVDGVEILMVFFATSGLPMEIEFIRMDGEAIRQLPSADRFVLAPG